MPLARWLVVLACVLASAIPLRAAAPPVSGNGEARPAVERDEAGRPADQVAHPGEIEFADEDLPEPPIPPELDTPDEVRSVVQSALGTDVPWVWDTSEANVVVVRNVGSGYRPSGSEASYDDLFLVVRPDGVTSFAHGNAEGTEHRTYVKKYGYDTYVDPEVGRSMTPALAPGIYRFEVGLHNDEYKALRLYTLTGERYGLPSQRRNGKFGKYEVGAVNVHKGGSVWNWSVGCLTIHYARFDDFIRNFTTGRWGYLYVVGDWDGKGRRPAR